MQTIQRKSLAQEVADQMQHSIESGAFSLNEKLPTEPELMKKFGVGRSTVREAIKYLAQSGFVTVLQGVGTFVASHTGNNMLGSKLEQANFTEVFEVRQLLEVKIVEKSVTARNAKHLAKMERKLKERYRYALEGKIAECIQADIEFHTTVAESCGNTILYELYKTMSLHVSNFFRDVYQDTAPFIETQALHESLLGYIKDRDIPKALKVAQKIIGTI